MTAIYTTTGHLLVQHRGQALAQVPVTGDPRAIVASANKRLRQGAQYTGDTAYDWRGRAVRAKEVCDEVYWEFKA